MLFFPTRHSSTISPNSKLLSSNSPPFTPHNKSAKCLHSALIFCGQLLFQMCFLQHAIDDNILCLILLAKVIHLSGGLFRNLFSALYHSSTIRCLMLGLSWIMCRSKSCYKIFIVSTEKASQIFCCKKYPTGMPFTTCYKLSFFL